MSDISNMKHVKPFIKWAGGKGQLLNYIHQAYPKELGDSICKYAEPFVGGGAVLLDILNTYELDDVYISDINRELIALYTTVRDNVDELISILSQYESDYLSKDFESKKVFYYSMRDQYNNILLDNRTNIDLVLCSSLFIFLNKTCFNGLYRVNSKGAFNVPIGSYKKPTICDSDNLRNVSQLLQNVKHIVNGSYLDSNHFIDKSTFVYFDPPYRPLNVTANFTSYAKDQFDENDQIMLANYARSLSERGAKVMISNSDPHNVNPNDSFFENLYDGMEINTVSATRAINSRGDSRGAISELLITSYHTVY